MTGQSSVGPGYLPRSLDDVVGHHQAVATIRRRFATGNHETALLLYGPDGVGKRTLALMYAKSLLCEGLRVDESAPCGKCEVCTTFERGSLFGLVQTNAELLVDLDYVREAMTNLLVNKRKVFIIDDIDRAAPEFLDLILKSLEGAGEMTERDIVLRRPIFLTFIFLTQHLKGVRATGQSRSMVQRLRPLNKIDTQVLSQRMLSASAIKLEDTDAMNALVEGSRGLPGRLLVASQKLQKSKHRDAESVRRVLGDDWGDALVNELNVILRGEAAPKEPAKGHKISSVVNLRHLLVVLEQLLSGIKNPDISEPALIAVDRQKLNALADRFHDCASALNISPLGLWQQLSEVCQREDYADDLAKEILYEDLARRC